MHSRGHTHGGSENSRLRGGSRWRSGQNRSMSQYSDQSQEQSNRNRSGNRGNRSGRPVVKGRLRGQYGMKHKIWIKRLPAREREYLNAALSGDIATLRRVINAELVDLNVTDEFGHTALINAAWKDRVDVVKLLLEKRVALNCRNHDGQTAMDKAAYWGFTDILQLLVDAGSTVDVHNNNGETPLHRAAMWGHVDAVKLLLEAKANGNAFRNQRRWTPLHFASKHGKSNVVLALLEGKSDPLIRDSNGRTSIELARRSKQHKVVMLLEKWQDFQEEYEHEIADPVIARIGEAGGWDAEEPCLNGHLTIAKKVCGFNTSAFQDSRGSKELILSIVGSAGLSLTLGLAVTADEIIQEENVFSVDPQLPLSIIPAVPEFSLERQEGISVRPRPRGQAGPESQVLGFQRLPGLQVAPAQTTTTPAPLTEQDDVVAQEEGSTECKEKSKGNGHKYRG